VLHGDALPGELRRRQGVVDLRGGIHDRAETGERAHRHQ
jgi:hypothetical protein